MIGFGKIKFIQEWEDGQKIVHEIRGDSSLDEVVEAFEMFLKGAGYHLPDGKHIGYEYEGDSTPQPDFEPTVTFTHSEHYYDTERNR